MTLPWIVGLSIAGWIVMWVVSMLIYTYVWGQTIEAVEVLLLIFWPVALMWLLVRMFQVRYLNYERTVILAETWTGGEDTVLTTGSGWAAIKGHRNGTITSVYNPPAMYVLPDDF